MEALQLTQEWDKTFPQSDKVNHSKVTFRNRYGITLAADLYMPKEAQGRLPAIAVCGPFGAVKEQAVSYTHLGHLFGQNRHPDAEQDDGCRPLWRR